PEGADAVLMQEDCVEADNRVTLGRVPRPGAYVRAKGEDMACGQTVLRRGTLLEAPQIAVLAAQGFARAPVFPGLSVGILTTDDELMRPGEPLRPAAVYDSNGPMLASLCRELGTAPPTVRHVHDDAAAIEQALAELAGTCDLVLSVGGASVGEKDLVKPVALAELHGRPLVCLPGNPVSSFVVFALLVSPLIRGQQGRHTVFPPVRRGVLTDDRARGGDREEFLRIQADLTGPTTRLTPCHQQSSGAISSLNGATGLARIPAGTQTPPGAEVAWYALADWLR